MYVIAVCSLISIAIAIERVIFHVRTHEDDEALLVQIRSLLHSRDMDEAIRIVAGRQSSFARSARDVLVAHKENRKDFEKVLEEALVGEEMRLERSVGWLAIIANIAPLLGLFGTVLGLVQCFDAIATTQGTVDPTLLAKGIRVALYTTVFGLIVSIPSYIFAQYFVMRNATIYSTMRAGTSHIIKILTSGQTR